MSSVSIIIPYKNNIKYFFLTLKSILNQTYKNFSIVIIYDDENKLDLIEIKKFIKEKKIIKKIKIIDNQKNIGVGRSRNIGIKYSKSEYIAFIDSDDLWDKNKLKLQIKFMKKEKIPISHTSYFLINENGEKISIRIAKKNLFFNDLIKSCDIGLSTVIVKTSFLKKNNLIFPSLSTKEDYVLWLKLIKISKVIKGLNRTLTYYRKRKDSLSSNLAVSVVNGYKVYKDHLRFGILKSIVRLCILSIYAIKKKITK